MKNRTCQGEERTERLEIQSLIGKQKERTTSMASGAERYEGMGGVAAGLKLQSSVSPRATPHRDGRAERVETGDEYWDREVTERAGRSCNGS